MLRFIFVPMGVLLIVWLLFGDGVLTSTGPGRDATRSARSETALSTRLENASDLVLQGPGGARPSAESESVPGPSAD